MLRFTAREPGQKASKEQAAATCTALDQDIFRNCNGLLNRNISNIDQAEDPHSRP